MDRFAALRMFVRVVEKGSFTAVARELGVGQPAVSKTMAALEKDLGMTLLHRTSRSLAITQPGQRLFDDLRPLLGELDQAVERAVRGDRAPAGSVRIGVAPGFASLYAVPAARVLRTRYPEISLELVVSERHVDLVAENIDLAIRAGELRDASVLAQRVGETPLLVVASKSYLDRHREPRIPADLEQHERIVSVLRGVRRPWRFRGVHPNIVHPSRVSLLTNNAEEIRAAVLADLGFAQVPGWLVAHDLTAGTICAVLRAYEPPPVRISLVRPPRRMPARVRAVADVFLHELAREPLLGMGAPQGAKAEAK
ncbi:LysR substrate-binding domain-containing protein [Pendulispora rubella]|uniref:LysR substrate-binding domain-containing protein n=1 Tax=Pendulispora rubella TaxID=2741070 RepID=A0ABZ2KTP4_9BACT